MNPLNFNQIPEKHEAEKNTSIKQKLNRILQIDPSSQIDNAPPENTNKGIMISKVIVRPNPFFTSITLDVTCSQGKHVIVRMFDEEEKIVKMFSWFLLKGINITSIGEVEMLTPGNYMLDIIDLEGEVVYSTKVMKGQ